MNDQMERIMNLKQRESAKNDFSPERSESL